MENFKDLDFKAFELFDQNWAIVTSGTMDHFNGCTIGWGSLGNIWRREGKSCPIVTVYIHPARYTSEFMNAKDEFTVSFFSEKYKKELAYIGSHSGKNENKFQSTSLTPVKIENSVTFEEANLVFLCKKLYAHQLTKEDLSKEIQEYYASMPKMYPDFKGGWQPHILYIGEVVEVIDKR